MTENEIPYEPIPEELFTVDESSSLIEKMNRLLDLKYELMKLAGQLDDCKAQYESLENEIYDDMTSEAVQRTTVAGHTLYLNPQTYISVKASGKLRAYEWLKENGYDHLLKTSVSCHAGTLTAEMKRRLQEGGDLPEDLFNHAVKNKIGIRKAK